MKYMIISAFLFVLLVQCSQRKPLAIAAPSPLPQRTIPVKDVEPVEDFHCTQGSMEEAWYEHGQNEAPPTVAGLQQEFLILVDSRLISRNFVSLEENHLREESVIMDTSNYRFKCEFSNLSPREKLRKVKDLKRTVRRWADSVHRANQRQQQIWIINNSADTVSIPIQDGSYICILQALTKGGHWCPVEYWRFSRCGNSYGAKSFPPNTANSFITQLPDKGDYRTKFRYKLLGKDRYYYSNMFDGRIDYCNFVEDSTTYTEYRGELQPHFKLDSVINLGIGL